MLCGCVCFFFCLSLGSVRLNRCVHLDEFKAVSAGRQRRGAPLSAPIVSHSSWQRRSRSGLRKEKETREEEPRRSRRRRRRRNRRRRFFFVSLWPLHFFPASFSSARFTLGPVLRTFTISDSRYKATAVRFVVNMETPFPANPWELILKCTEFFFPW